MSDMAIYRQLAVSATVRMRDDRATHVESKPFRDAPMMRTRTASAAAETVTAVPTLRSCSLRLARTIFGPRNSLPLFIHISTVAATSGLNFWFRGCVGNASARLL